MNMNVAIPPLLQRTSGTGRVALKQEDGETRLATLYQEGAAKLRLPRRPVAAPAEMISINTAGGLTGGDDMRWQVELGPGSQGVWTTQACEKLYRSAGGDALVHATLRLGAGARLAWLPQETILFDGARLRRRLDVRMAEDAELVLLEPVIFGRQHMANETVRTGFLHDSWRIRRADMLIHAEEMRLQGSVAAHLARQAVAGGDAALATLLYVGPRAEALLAGVRAALADRGAAAEWNGKLLARMSARDGYSLRKTVSGVMQALNSAAELPKVWSI